MKTDVEIKYNIKVLENVEEITWEFLGEVASYVNEFVEIQLAASDLLGTSYLKASVLDVATELHGTYSMKKSTAYSIYSISSGIIVVTRRHTLQL